MLELKLLNLNSRIITEEDRLQDMIFVSRQHVDYNEKIIAASEGEGDGQIKYGKNVGNLKVSGSTFQGMSSWSGNKHADLYQKTKNFKDNIADAYVTVEGNIFITNEKEEKKYTYLISVERLGKKRVLEIKTDTETLSNDFEEMLKETFINVKYNEKMLEKIKDYVVSKFR